MYIIKITVTVLITMIKNPIRVYARIKKEKKNERLWQYEIISRKKYDNLILKCSSSNELSMKSQSYKFRFNKVFNMESTQVSLFETIARPVVNSVIDGFNGTIFAYGQTGSGKTFSITGSPQEYNERGIIPRSIEAILEIVAKNPRKYTVYISYLEIYNEVGYDLLTAKHQSAPQVEELPRVVLLEDGKGEAHLRNLTILPVTNVQEAMRLLFLGDTNRIIVETPMNDCSSRSHCIFTIYIYNRREHTAHIRKSKLHLVDLAGSERVYKTNITGQTLTEAKYINLSLHYLERVITALSQAKRTHIPYRNSMMTYMLRDSLGGNCLTVMIATLAMTYRSMEESLSTCRFAQRVALIHTEPVINEETDSFQELVELRNENDKLKKQLQLLTGITMEDPVLTPREIEFCHSAVDHFLSAKSDDLAVDVRQPALVRYCFALLKQSILKEKQESKLRSLNSFNKLIPGKDDSKYSASTTIYTTNEEEDCAFDSQPNNQMAQINKDRFSAFMADPENLKDMNYFKSALQQNYTDAAKFADGIEHIKTRIIETKKEIENNMSNSKAKYKLNMNLMHLQNSYKNTLSKLQEIKNKTDHLKCGLEQTQIKLLKKYYKQNCHDTEYEQKIEQFSQLLNGKLRSNLFQDSFSDNQLKRDSSNAAESKFKICCEYPRNLIRKKSSSDTNLYVKPSDKLLSHSEDSKVDKPKLYNIFNSLKLPEISSAKTAKPEEQSKDDREPFLNVWTPQRHEETRASKVRKPKIHESTKLPDTSKELFIKESCLTDSNYKSEALKTLNSINNNNNNNNKVSTPESNHKISSPKHGLPNETEVSDNEDFLRYMKSIQLTGDNEVDDEIYHFYKSVFHK